jgi:hypothetical protein
LQSLFLDRTLLTNPLTLSDSNLNEKVSESY